jgi:hypothetical protein
MAKTKEIKQTANQIIKEFSNSYGNCKEDLADLYPDIIAATSSVTAAFFNKRNLPYVRHLLGFKKSRCYLTPQLGEYYYPKEFEQQLDDYLSPKKKDKDIDPVLVEKRRLTAEKAKATRLANRQKRFMILAREQFPGMPEDDMQAVAEHCTQFNTGRVGTIQDTAASVKPAVIAHIRHHHTDYDDMMSAYCDGYNAARRCGEEEFELPDGNTMNTLHKLTRGYPCPLDVIKDACRDKIRPTIEATLKKWQA